MFIILFANKIQEMFCIIKENYHKSGMTNGKYICIILQIYLYIFNFFPVFPLTSILPWVLVRILEYNELWVKIFSLETERQTIITNELWVKIYSYIKHDVKQSKFPPPFFLSCYPDLPFCFCLSSWCYSLEVVVLLIKLDYFNLCERCNTWIV